MWDITSPHITPHQGSHMGPRLGPNLIGPKKGPSIGSTKWTQDGSTYPYISGLVSGPKGPSYISIPLSPPPRGGRAQGPFGPWALWARDKSGNIRVRGPILGPLFGSYAGPCLGPSLGSIWVHITPHHHITSHLTSHHISKKVMSHITRC